MTLSIGYYYLSLEWLSLPIALLWSTASGAMLMSVLMLIQMFASDQRTGNILTMESIFPLMMVGGSFFPSEVMTSWMAAVGRLTPNGWALERLKAILLRREEIQSLCVNLLGLLAMAFLFFTVCSWRIRTHLMEG